MVGYSGNPLVKKLGFKPNSAGLVLHAPQEYAVLLGEIPPGARLDSGWQHESGTLAAMYDFIHYFTRDRAALEQDFAILKAALKPGGVLWISWLKGQSRLAAGLNENQIRETGLAHGLVDVKVAAIDADWSGLKFVYRLKDRS
ncbi:MAG TPA: hypothetical protein VMT46_03645 [Anaerolineaceae bacterium]|nr:hypothetical protein [Anaerolineaceae bacterium]